MSEEGLNEREATLGVERGLYLLRYASGAPDGPSPIARVRPARGSEPFVEVVSAPGVVAGMLAAPGDCAVVRAEQSAKLTIRISGQGEGGRLDASFQLQPLGGVRGSAEVSSPAVVLAAPAKEGFSILAHVSRRGDVVAPAGEWVAGPDSPAPIEGVEVRGVFPAGVAIEARALVGVKPPRWSDWASVGVFAGTRGRSLPLAGLRLRLVGECAEYYELDVGGLFLGSAIIDRRGREVELVSTAGADPLVGLRVNLTAVAVEPVLAVPAVVSGDASPENTFFADQRQEPRVRVFRAAAN